MGTVNQGNQTIVYDYKYPAKGRDFSKSFRGIIKPGIYSGGLITQTGDNTISIAVMTIVINSGDDKCVKITTSSVINLSVTDAATVIYAKFDWVDRTDNYADFSSRASGSPVTNEVVIGELTFGGGVITGISYANKDYGLFDSNYNMYLDGTLNVDTIQEKTSGSGVDIEDITFTDGDITGVDSLILDDGIISGASKINASGLEGVGIEEVSGNILRTKIIEIGDWDMDSNGSVDITHGISSSSLKIKSVIGIIRADGSPNNIHQIGRGEGASSGVLQSWVNDIGSSTVQLVRLNSGLYDNASYNSTSYNRGWIIIQYID